MKEIITIKGKLIVNTPNSDATITDISPKDLLIEAMKAIAINEGLNTLDVEIEMINEWLNQDWVNGVLEQFNIKKS